MQPASTRAWLVGLALACATGACRKSPAGANGKHAIVERRGEPDFIHTPPGDPELEAAKHEAQKTLPEFVKALRDRPFGSTRFAFKKKFVTKEHEEFIWLSDVTLEEDGFSGEVDNEPVWVRGVELGARVRAKKDEVVDWAYVLNGELVGGYTIRVLYKREPPEKQRELDEQFTISR